jgi:putative heme-binding domain-containing protein
MLLALARQYPRPDSVRRQPELDTLPPDWQDNAAAALRRQFQPENGLVKEFVSSLNELSWERRNDRQRLDLLRVYEVSFCRFGPPTQEDREKVIAQLSPHYPAKTMPLNWELVQLLVYLDAPDTAGRTLKLMADAPTQEEQIALATALRLLQSGWTMDQRREYFQWFLKAADYKGGASFGLFVQDIKNEAVAALDDKTREALKPIIDAQPLAKPEVVESPREFVKDWQVSDLLPLVEAGLHGRDYARGRRLFAAGKCYACHRFNNEGGAFGPDLTAVSGRFNPRDLLESVIEPSKVVSDQYQGVKILTVDGKVITGRIVNLSGDEFRVNTDMLDPDKLEIVDRKQIEEMLPDEISMMPKGLLNTFSKEEALDLVAYLLSRGNPGDAVFKP